MLLKPDNSVKAAYKPSQGALTVIPVIAQLLGPCLPPRRIHHPGLQFIRCSASSGCVKHPFCTCSGPQMCKLWPEYWRFAVSHQNKPPLHAQICTVPLKQHCRQLNRKKTLLRTGLLETCRPARTRQADTGSWCWGRPGLTRPGVAPPFLYAALSPLPPPPSWRHLFVA